MNSRLSLCSMSLDLGRVPLFPCFLDDNTTSSIPYKYTARQKQAFEFGCADRQGPASRRGSDVHEINTWMWNFGRPQPRVGGLSVAKQRGSTDSPGLKHPCVLGRHRRPARLLLKRFNKYIPCVYLVCACHIHFLIKKRFWHMGCPLPWQLSVHASSESWIQFYHLFGSNDTIKPTKSIFYVCTIQMHGIYQEHPNDPIDLFYPI